ncbi:MAG: cytochrome c oxidase subunit II [Anaerolineae bacterium]|nr:cytochrome c oxidase subunit II [Anaerolineae bacterium]
MPRALSPGGYIAARIASLWWFMFAIGAAVFLVVTAYLLLALARRRSAEAAEPGVGPWLVTWGGAIVPGAIVLALMVATVHALSVTMNPIQPVGLTVEVSAYQWWWDVHYPEQGFRTANEIHIPVGRPVRVMLQGGDVIHSFWVPELAGKTDMMPGEVTQTWLQADEVGTFRGLCAEFCGLQHAQMQFLVISHPESDYVAWLGQQAQPAPTPGFESTLRGLEIFLSSACVGCHTIRGTTAIGTLGPDLTHVASRKELAAGTVDNTVGNLAGWILDSQSLKQGNLMPPMPMPPEDLLALLSYMETLR